MRDALNDELKDLNIQLNELGAIIINSDGTMSKISNWHELTKPEQVKALRVIAKRNKKRKEELEAATETQNVEQPEEEQDSEVLMIENK